MHVNNFRERNFVHLLSPDRICTLNTNSDDGLIIRDLLPIHPQHKTSKFAEENLAAAYHRLEEIYNNTIKFPRLANRTPFEALITTVIHGPALFLRSFPKSPLGDSHLPAAFEIPRTALIIEGSMLIGDAPSCVKCASFALRRRVRLNQRLFCSGVVSEKIVGKRRVRWG
ncbi:hypothetical protein Trydic_g5007 [Trypoxylus dichotomus]